MQSEWSPIETEFSPLQMLFTKIGETNRRLMRRIRKTGYWRAAAWCLRAQKDGKMTESRLTKEQESGNYMHAHDPAPEAPSSSSNSNRLDTNDANQQSQRSKIAALEDRIRKGEVWMIWLTAAIAFLGLCSVCVALLQWRAMSGQLQEMKSGSIDTHALALAAQKQAEAAKDQVNQMSGTQRPWLGISNPIRVTGPFFEVDRWDPTQIEATISTFLTFRNFGNSVAEHETLNSGLLPQNMNEGVPEALLSDLCKWGEIDIRRTHLPKMLIMPGTQIREGSNASAKIPPGTTHIDNFWIMACAVYEDNMGAMHHTELLYLTQPRSGARAVSAGVPGRSLTYDPIGSYRLWDARAN